MSKEFYGFDEDDFKTKNAYDSSKRLHDLDGWIVFYGQQAQRLESDLAMAEVFQASCETADLLLELKSLQLLRQDACQPKERVRADEEIIGQLFEHLALIEHKIDQHLQGQYNSPPYPALGVALAEARKALLLKEQVSTTT